MKTQIKMIGLDLDGTLLDSQKKMTAYTVRVITEAIQKGIVVLAATGRPYTGIPKEIRKFPGMWYAVTANGGRIVDTRTQKTIIEHLLPLKSAKKTLEIFRKYDTLQEVYFDGQGYADREKLQNIEKYHHDFNMWEYVRTSRIAVDDIRDVVQRENRPLDKVQALFANMEELEKAREELRKNPEIVLVGSLGYNIEVNAAGVDKGMGLLKLGEMLGIHREEIMAIGDGDNDIAMIKAAGLGIAMGNAEEEVKASADYVTGTNDEDGAAKAILKFALGGR